MAQYPAVTTNGLTMQFYAGEIPPHLTPTYSLVIPFYENQIVICNIVDRGWCIPSGRIESGESPKEAAKREAHEEACISLEEIQTIGFYELSTDDSTQYASLFSANVSSLKDFFPTNEVLDRQVVTLRALPDIYYEWNPLMAAVFDYATKLHSSNS
ncbi:MAG: NUDIX domain-containing protein [Fimbriimonadaceae bacterium]|nr:MAG: NUDIX domain-containing protein [Fimbriimonadaceae bacterium]